MNCRPKFMLYHPNAKATGTAIALELIPATTDVEGGVNIAFANQLTVSKDVSLIEYDFNDAIRFKLRFNELCEMLQVFRGETETIDYGRGMHIVEGDKKYVVNLAHMLEPTSCYRFYVSTKVGDVDRFCNIFLSYAEALGLSEAIAGSMNRVVFGNPYYL